MHDTPRIEAESSFDTEDFVDKVSRACEAIGGTVTQGQGELTCELESGQAQEASGDAQLRIRELEQGNKKLPRSAELDTRYGTAKIDNPSFVSIETPTIGTGEDNNRFMRIENPDGDHIDLHPSILNK